MITRKGLNIHISNNAHFKGSAEIGHSSIVGDYNSDAQLTIGNNARIGRFCFIEGGINIGDNFELDDYCGVYTNAVIGHNVKLLYGKKIYGRSSVGNHCIISGNIPERCILADNVTFAGEVAHSHYNPQNDWDTTDEPSPVIGKGSVIGVNALLIGGITIGKNCYVSAGEILRHDLEDNMVFIKNKVVPLSAFKGLIRTRYSDD